MPRKSTFEVRVSVSVMLPEDRRVEEGQRFGPLRCEEAEYHGEIANLRFVGEVRSWKRWAVAAHAMRHLNKVIEDGTEVVLYIEEKSWRP